MRIIKPAAREAQAPPDDQDEIKTAKEHTRAVFAWLDVVAADAGLPSSAFRVAYVIAQCLNKKTGEAFPGTDEIARRAGLVQSTVRLMINKLIERGHLAVEFGSRGRGHPNSDR